MLNETKSQATANNSVLNEVTFEISELMKEVLADQFVLYTKARNYHWNVTGPHFFGLHAAFENIYNGLADDIDNVAERIRVLGFKTPGTMKEFLDISTLNEEPGKYPNYSEMIQKIIIDFTVVTDKLKAAAYKMQNNLNDEISAGMFYGLSEKYQKTVWMLRSILEK
ncbi:MAG: DNA starvation/stationary phase protection protein [Ignavibacteriae bacterium HGW-Ignavibacteriae-2]|jgi:starvation-inducible DNA-binding protein|nr:MAG: DNA starvation/stationary phase protection protein [Ignavibacteriae bacterium HGW-Ignavibacteriae-2]